MELIYLYIEDIGRPLLRHTDFHFGANFRAEYDKDNQKLKIERKPSRRPSLYGKRIQSLDLIVGVNGSGKSSIMNLLGLPWGTRKDMFPISASGSPDDRPENRRRWFALYHLERNLFALEGYWFDTVSKLFPNQDGGYVQPDYSVFFPYDFQEQRPGGFEFLQYYEIKLNGKIWRDEDGMPMRGDEALRCVLYQTQIGIGWLEETRIRPDADAPSAMFKRPLAKSGYVSVTEYLYDSVVGASVFSEALLPLSGCSIQISCRSASRDEIPNRQRLLEEMENGTVSLKPWANGLNLLEGGVALNALIEEAVAKALIYGGWTNELARNVKTPHFSAKERMVLFYLEEITLFLMREFIKSENIGWKQFFDTLAKYMKDNLATDMKTDRSYAERREFLLKSVQSLSQRLGWMDYAIAERMVQGLEAIPDRFFGKDGESAEIMLTDFRAERENFLMALMEAQDWNRHPYFADELAANHASFLPVAFRGLSAGETHFLDFYAALYGVLRQSGTPKNYPVLLLLDEPDSRFHPEWSRRFIRYLTKLLNPSKSDKSATAETFRKYRYQVIITSHSPMLMSDVPCENIQCLHYDKKRQKVEARPSRYGFMSSVSDMLKDSFFVDSIFGEFSAQYVKSLIRKISRLEKACSANALDTLPQGELDKMGAKLGEIQDDMQIIRDEVISLHLSRRLERIRRHIEWRKSRTPDAGKDGDAP